MKKGEIIAAVFFGILVTLFLNTRSGLLPRQQFLSQQGGLRPILTVNPLQLSFNATLGGANPPPQTIAVANTGGGTLEWSATDDASWLSVTPASGTGDVVLAVQVNIIGLTVETYSSTITISGATGTVNSPVAVFATLTLTAPAPPESGEVLVKRVGSDLSSGTAPPGTTGWVDALPPQAANPASFSNLPVGSHAAYATDVANYLEEAGGCSYAIGDAECSVTAFPLIPVCDGSGCSVQVSVTADAVAKVVFKYTSQAVGPTPPSGLTAQPKDGAVQLSWTASADPAASGYRMYRKLNLGANQFKLLTQTSGSSYLDASVVNGLPYEYFAVSFNALGGEGPPTPVVAVIPAAAAIAGAEEIVFAGDFNPNTGSYSGDSCAFLDLPDTPARAFKDGAGNIQLLSTFPAYTGNTYSAFVGNFRMIGPDFNTLKRDCVSGPVLVPTPDADLTKLLGSEWMGGPYRIPGTDKVYTLVHTEISPPGCTSPQCTFYAITASASTDGGKKYTHPSNYKAAVPPYAIPTANNVPSGIDGPSNIIRGPDGKYYAFVKAIPYPSQPAGACLLRADDISSLNPVWKMWDGTGFNTAMDGTKACKVLTADSVYGLGPFDVGVSTVAWSTYFGKYLAVGDYGQWTDLDENGSNEKLLNGAYYWLSDDLITWGKPKLIGSFAKFFYSSVPPAGLPLLAGGTQILYPSLIDHGSGDPNFTTVGPSAYLYFAIQDDPAVLTKRLARVPVTFLAAGAGEPIPPPLPPSPPPPPSPPAPLITAACSGSAAQASISWQESGLGAQGYTVEIDSDDVWSNGYWAKSVAGGATNTDTPSGFNPVVITTPLSFTAGATYSARVYYAAGQVYSETASFVAPSCGSSQPPAAGTAVIKRVGTDLLAVSAPTGTKAWIDALADKTENPATFANVAVGTHTAYVTDVSGYTETANTCTYPAGGAECFVTTFPTVPTCSASSCSVPISVSADTVTKVVFQYAAAEQAPPPPPPSAGDGDGGGGGGGGGSSGGGSGGGSSGGGGGGSVFIPPQNAQPPVGQGQTPPAQQQGQTQQQLKAPAGSGQAGTYSFTFNFGKSSSGAHVAILQKFLNADAATQIAISGVGSKGNETQFFGALTEIAVQKFQKKYGIAAAGDPGYGYVGPKTRAKLNAFTGAGAAIVAPVTPPPATAPAGSMVFTKTVSVGVTDAQVTLLQEYLKKTPRSIRKE